MCCFSRPVVSVSTTRIFARPGDNGRQFLVYSMAIEARTELAMILPLPVQLPAGENDVEFVNLKGYPNFFSDLAAGFPVIATLSAESRLWHGEVVSASSPLAVVTVGDFEASFVPTVKDFSRLDERFRLEPGVWKDLPGYGDYSFAVFKLKPGAMTVHPMAFSFPRRDRRTIFFPTVHIHDGKVHKKAEFDHVLYCQSRSDERLSIYKWKESYTVPAKFMQVEKSKGIILPDQHCYKLAMTGKLDNRDTFLAVEA
jgi:hypothetical protein